MHREERTMTTIYLIRHAEAEGNVFRRIHGQYDSCVTPNGRRQIAALAQRFAGIPVDAVYASDLKRTCLTATAIYRQKGLPAPPRRALPRGRPRPWEDTPFGELERRYPAQLHAFSHDSYHWYVEGAECFLQYAHRFLAGLDDVVRRHEGQSIAIFSHGMVLRGALIELFFPGQDEGVSHSENTAVTELHWENGSYELISLNDATHLTPELSTLGRQNWWRGSRYLDFNMWYRDVAPEDAPLLAALGCPQTEPGDRVRIAMLRDTPAGMVATGAAWTAMRARCCIWPCCRSTAAAAGGAASGRGDLPAACRGRKAPAPASPGNGQGHKAPARHLWHHGRLLHRADGRITTSCFLLPGMVE